MPCLPLHFCRQNHLGTDVTAKTAGVQRNIIVDAYQRLDVDAPLSIASVAKIANVATTANAVLAAHVNKLQMPWYIPRASLFLTLIFGVFRASFFY